MLPGPFQSRFAIYSQGVSFIQNKPHHRYLTEWCFSDDGSDGHFM